MARTQSGEGDGLPVWRATGELTEIAVTDSRQEIFLQVGVEMLHRASDVFLERADEDII
jgi:hypothetical protein